jgi:hypothetical protein
VKALGTRNVTGITADAEVYLRRNVSQVPGIAFQVGFLVKLNSGGPKMTVVDISEDYDGPFVGKVKCQ